MKKNKGITLAELIVSIALVSVVCVYFFQTIITINKMYNTVNEDTNEYLHKLYLLRLAEAYKNKPTNPLHAIDAVKLRKYDLPNEYSSLVYSPINKEFIYGSAKIIYNLEPRAAIASPESPSEGGNVSSTTTSSSTTTTTTTTNNTPDTPENCDIYCTMYKIGEDEGIAEGDCMEYSSLSDNSKNLLNDYNSLPKENASICYISKSDENKENKNNVSETYSYSTKKYEYCVFGFVSSYSNNTNSCKKRKF